jgi:hypothetical protein
VKAHRASAETEFWKWFLTTDQTDYLRIKTSVSVLHSCFPNQIEHPQMTQMGADKTLRLLGICVHLRHLRTTNPFLITEGPARRSRNRKKAGS